MPKAEQVPSTTSTDSSSFVQQMSDKVTAIPSAMAEAVADKTVELAGSIAENIIDSAKAAALKQLEELLAQKQNAINVKSSLKVLMDQYNKEKSYLSELVDWYGKKSWFDKVYLGSLFFVTNAVLIAIVNSAFIYAIIANSLYYAATFLIMNDYDIKSRRDKQLYEDIVAMEADLAKSAIELNDAIEQLNNLHTAACQQNIQAADQIKTFNEQISTFDGLTKNYEETIKNLELTATTMISDHEEIVTQFQNTINAFEKPTLEITRQSTDLNSVTNELEKTNNELLTRDRELADLNQTFQAHSIALSELEEKFKAYLTTLESGTIKDEVSADKALDARDNTDNIMKKSDNLLLKIQLPKQESDDESSDDEKQWESEIIARAAKVLALVEERRITSASTSTRLVG